MDTSREVLLDVWREACRHIRIEESIGAITGILSRSIPNDGLFIVGYDGTKGLLHPRGVGALPVGWTNAQAIDPGSAEKRQRLERWIDRGQLSLHQAGSEPGSIEMLAGILAEDRGDWVLAPLGGPRGGSGARGILLLRLRSAATLTEEQLGLIRALVEPFSIALENDIRLNEMNALREAAEAEKRSVLSRLGRDDLIETIIGRDGGIRQVMERVGLVAGSDIPVLILGETGSGKEVIARAVHEQSGRSAGPFIRVNCGAISPELIDSELFGHEKGAFTGATSVRRGWFERADTGTLLLDEIGELPIPAQVRLLRVLQEGVFERVGGERPIHVDVRIVAATHRDLPGMVQRGKFREDLWYRITGFQLILPPLRERKEDIPALANHFAERAGRRFGLRPLALTAEDLFLLSSYHWPGNIRELASVIDRAAILGGGDSLEVARALGAGSVMGSLAEERGAGERLGGGEAVIGSRPEPVDGPGLVTLDAAMRRHIEAALAATRGQIEGNRGAAKLLDINPHTLRARMRKYGVDWSRFRESDGLRAGGSD